jgi:pimeloyl-ACP methyl ester carboxylesterase
MLPRIALNKDLAVYGRTHPVIEAGEGPLVVCLHGFPDNTESFQHLIEPCVAAGYRVLCPTMPGYAPGTQPSSGSNTPVYACREISALIEGLLKGSGETSAIWSGTIGERSSATWSQPRDRNCCLLLRR